MNRKKSRFAKLHSSPIVLSLLAIIAFFVINATFNIYDKNKAASTYVEESKEELEALKQREKELEAQLVLLETEEGIEREVRETFGFVREGEKVLVIIDEELEVEQVLPSSPSLWQRIRNFFR